MGKKKKDLFGVMNGLVSSAKDIFLDDEPDLQQTRNTEIQSTVNTDRNITVKPEIQEYTDTETQLTCNTETQKAGITGIQMSSNTDMQAPGDTDIQEAVLPDLQTGRSPEKQKYRNTENQLSVLPETHTNKIREQQMTTAAVLPSVPKKSSQAPPSVKKKATYLIDGGVVKRLKYLSADTGRDLSSLVEEALRLYLEQKGY